MCQPLKTSTARKIFWLCRLRKTSTAKSFFFDCGKVSISFWLWNLYGLQNDVFLPTFYAFSIFSEALTPTGCIIGRTIRNTFNWNNLAAIRASHIQVRYPFNFIIKIFFILMKELTNTPWRGRNYWVDTWQRSVSSSKRRISFCEILPNNARFYWNATCNFHIDLPIASVIAKFLYEHSLQDPKSLWALPRSVPIF